MANRTVALHFLASTEDYPQFAVVLAPSPASAGEGWGEGDLDFFKAKFNSIFFC